MKQTKIGLTTFHLYNYGSALQCYATQEYLKERGAIVEVIDFPPQKGAISGYASTAAHLISLCILYPASIRSILAVFKSQRRGALRITKASESEVSRFNTDFINCVSFNKNTLKHLAKSDEYDVFLSGSDQVWNAYRIDRYDLYFLRFAPKNKRVSWAASFGGNEIASYNKKRYTKYLNEYNAISVREPSAVEVVKRLTNREAICLSDPVELLDSEKWRAQYKMHAGRRKENDKFILYFFLDNPSDLAVNMTNQLSKKTGFRIISFGYKQDGAYSHVDGGPWDFLSLIDGAEYVMTDSFHATVFALLFHKMFYVFERQYVHKQSQTSRITDLLDRMSLSDRYNPEQVDDRVPDYSFVEKVFMEDRNAFNSYTSEMLKTS